MICQFSPLALKARGAAADGLQDRDELLRSLITIEPTTDLKLVRSIVTEPACYRLMTNDSAPEREAFQVAPGLDLTYLIARMSTRPVGLFLLKPMTGGLAEAHFCIRPEAWGMLRTEAIVCAFLEWVWTHTGISALRGPIPAFNRLALRLARAVGFEQQDRQPGRITKHGKAFDLLILGLKRPESFI